MRRFSLAVVVVLLVGTARAQTDPAAILEKAIQAHGGEAKLAKIKAATWTAKGKVFGSGDPTEYTAEWLVQFPGQFKLTIESDLNGVPLKQVRVLNGDKAWVKYNKDDTLELDKDAVADDRAHMKVQWLTTLLPLRDKAFTLAAISDTKVGDRPAVGIKVTAKDTPEVRLFFDKEKGLLLRFEFMSKDLRSGKDVKQEIQYEDYREVNGVQKAMKHIIRRDGKKSREQEISDLKLLEKLDDKKFAKP